MIISDDGKSISKLGKSSYITDKGVISRVGNGFIGPRGFSITKCGNSYIVNGGISLSVAGNTIIADNGLNYTF